MRRPLAGLGHALGRALDLAWYGVAVLAGAAAIALGLFRPTAAGTTGLLLAPAPWGGTLREAVQLFAALALALLLLLRLFGAPARTRRLRTSSLDAAAPPPPLRPDLELGGMLLVAAYALFQATGGARSLIHPLAYALVAFAVTLQRRPVGLALWGWAMLLEGALLLAAPPSVRPRVPSDLTLLGAHLAFLALFAGLHLALLGVEVVRQRREHQARLDGEVRRLRDEARDFRLIGSQLPAASRPRSREQEQEIIAAASVDTIHQALFYTLELLKHSLGLHTAVLLWLDEAGERLVVKELASDSDAIAAGPVPRDAGAIGAVWKERAPVRLRDPRPEHLPYYAAPQPVGALLAVPILEPSGDEPDAPLHLRGVLCVDRLVTRAEGGEAVAVPFDERDEQLLGGAAREILRAVRAERIFLAVERGKFEHEALFRASDQLNRALTPEQVWETSFAAARELAPWDFAAITRYDAAERRHAVVAAVGEGHEEVAGLTFSDNAGLVAMAIKNRHPLPATGERRDKDIPIFTRRARLRPFDSLLVLPLMAGGEPIGTMVLAARAARRFGKDRRELLGVIANQVAVSARNAELYRAMEQMATTDGLTGLLNHRAFQERLADLLLRAERHGTTLSLLLTDIDHFKKVNDTHGHPVGDQVLRGVAAVCRGQVRKIDVAARYGGEEFAIVLDGTDRDGALQLAERIRREVQAQTFSSEKGPFSCTLSLGVASYPDDGRDAKALISHADQALYHAKHSGRNRACAWAHLEAQPQLPLRAVK